MCSLTCVTTYPILNYMLLIILLYFYVTEIKILTVIILVIIFNIYFKLFL